MANEPQSPSGTLNKTDAKSLAVTSLAMGVAYGLTYFAQNMTNVDFGPNSPLVMIVLTFVIDLTVKYLQGPKKEVK